MGWTGQGFCSRLQNDRAQQAFLGGSTSTRNRLGQFGYLLVPYIIELAVPTSTLGTAQQPLRFVVPILFCILLAFSMTHFDNRIALVLGVDPLDQPPLYDAPAAAPYYRRHSRPGASVQ